jgi:uncharacterized membrane protein
MENIINNFSEQLAILPFITGIIFTIAGLITYRFPPKKINNFYGYRTGTSMKNQEIWDFAQKYSSIQMVKAGVFLFIISIICMFFDYSEQIINGIGFVVLFFAVIYLFLTTERAIKRNFPNP